MVKPDDLIKNKYDNDVDRAILKWLHLMRNGSPYSASEIASAMKDQYTCKNLHLFALPTGAKDICPICHQDAHRILNQNPAHAERTVRNHLLSLHAEGDLLKMVRESTGDKGRTPDVYRLSDAFKRQLDDYLNIKEMELGYQMSATILCNDPMQCSDPGCKLCAKYGIKTKWDKK
jgi:hypothetical protein